MSIATETSLGRYEIRSKNLRGLMHELDP